MAEGGGQAAFSSHGDAAHRTSKRVLVMVACLSMFALATIVVVSRSGGTRTVLASVSVGQTLQQAALVKSENKKLEEEDHMMENQVKLMEKALEDKQKAAALDAAKAREDALEKQNAELSLENEKMKQAALTQRVKAEMKKLKSIRAQLTGQAPLSAPTAHPSYVQPTVAAVPARKRVDEAIEQQAKGYDKSASVEVKQAAELAEQEQLIDQLRTAQGKIATAKSTTSNLVGQYVAKCHGSLGCEKVYLPQNDSDWQNTSHTVKVTANGIGYPLGPVEEQGKDHYHHPWHDIIPKYNKLGGHWITFGAKDSFVPYENSVVNPAHVLPPWRKELIERAAKANNETYESEVKKLKQYKASAWHLRCPGAPHTGKGCLTDSDGVDGVREHTWYSREKGWNTLALEKRGLVVDNWPGLDDHEKHKWNRAAEDHPPKDPPPVSWDKLERPQWAWENNAMKSLAWNPEGKKNQDLMLGVGWNESDNVFGDEFKHPNEYRHQLEVRLDTEHPQDDHFADWEPKSEKNQRLLYGNSELSRSVVWSPKLHMWIKNSWGIGDVPVDSKEAIEDAHVLGTRTGEPISDGLLKGWSGANMVATTHNNIHSLGVNETDKKVPVDKLTLMGVNTNSWVVT